MPKSKVAWFCAALWPTFTPPLTPGSANLSNTSLVLDLVYSNEDVLGSAVRTQLFYQEIENVFDHLPYRRLPHIDMAMARGMAWRTRWSPDP